MSQPELQPDTKKVLDEQKLSHDFVASEAWAHVKDKFIQKIVDNSSLHRIVMPQNTTNEVMARELTARGLLATLALQWLKDVEGDAASYEQNLALLQQGEQNQIIQHFQ